MRNWMLTPIIVVGLAGAGLDLRNPERARSVSLAEREHSVLAGARLGLRQLGPLRPGDDEVQVAVRHHEGPRPDLLRAWIADRGGAGTPVTLRPDHDLSVLAVPTTAVAVAPRLWLEAEVGADRGRAVFALES